MKKTISTLVAVGLLSSMLVNTAHAGDHNGGINPLWIPVAVLSTLAAVTTVAPPPPPVVYERHVMYEPRRTVVYEEPRHTWRDHNPERRVTYYYGERDHSCDVPSYRHYR